ncbi:IS200/IS605 family transposase [Polaribacter cellanae]|uniref:IS200/IS605 family transposase n=1 Tax=Polaribacter cellanae TaxID=2818493 RepID=A0A975CMG4_9FLAO|nr:IS200/IS605 family transposase [Polaribacter cellanae]QTE21245.1 IS200/IS605 family transposase [Polaribacter cellanae]
MSKYKKLSHVVYKCDYHIVWVPKYRFRILKGAIKELVERDIRMLCEWKHCEVGELTVQEDHIHLLVSVPPKVSISKLMGTLKGKIAIKLFKSYPKLKKKPYWGNHFWARGYFVSTVGLDEEMIKRYVKYQEKEEKRVEDQQQKFDF